MRRRPLESSSLRAAGYDGARRVLDVEFHTGRIYRYFAVPREVYTGLLAAASKGRYYNAHIRDNYDYDRLA
ncbi:KTSC domain-containing protein [Prauserella muralis]|uniref:KTSC domain-containing protein n=1 Tax=Prauserella muralis TaxID=588067 RepID=A0A2V4BB77_9PSEU|nr:KTSC domain-containing protein [Prauserella muralis]PXY32510.1 KTSC domain-containing protein [Prauserella muralis]TWE23785.1 KTSC domain-containing protein [Prauserella muralis]